MTSTPVNETAAETPSVVIRQRPRGEAEQALAQEIDPWLARLLAARGITDASQLELGLSELLPPEPLAGIDRAAELLVDAVMQQRSILVVGDFDADGATASAVAVSALASMGGEKIDFLVPNRFDFGYGLTPEIVALAEQRRAELIVTVDNGISSIQGVAAARDAGMTVIVTDHHLPGSSLPDADAIVNPNLPDCPFISKALAGVGVIFYVMGRVRRELRERNWFDDRKEPNMADFLDLVALGTVADVVPLDHNNRILIQQGLQRIRRGRARPGILALCEVAERDPRDLSAEDLAFALGPRLNAAGRLDDMAMGIRCLLSRDMQEARSLASALDQLNRARREIESEMVEDAEVALAGLSLGNQGSGKLGLAIYDPAWHQGVVGILAGRIRERYHRPVVAFAEAGASAEGELKGSGRSIQGVHIRDVLDAIATRFPGLILKFGGHAMAAGLSIRRIHFERFASAFDQEMRNWISEDDLEGTLWSDGELQPGDLTLETVASLEDAGPWGQHFPEPRFHGIFRLVSQRVVGEKHLKMTLKLKDRLIDAIAFRQQPLPDVQHVLVYYKIAKNEWNDRTTLQLVVDYIAPEPSPESVSKISGVNPGTGGSSVGGVESGPVAGPEIGVEPGIPGVNVT